MNRPRHSTPARRPGPASPVLALWVCLLAAVGLFAAPAAGQLLLDDLPEDAQGAEVVERLGETAETSVVLTNSSGEAFRVADVFRGKPVLLALVYYDCPIICDLTLERLHASLRDLDYTIGEDFTLLIVSFDPSNTPTLAANKKLLYTSGYNRPLNQTIRDGWIFATGTEGSVRALADSVGFHYRRMSNGEYAHPSALIVLSPEAKVTRYIYGLDYPARQLKLSLLDASEGRIAASLGDRVLHFCFRYDPTAGAYSVEAMRVVQLGGIVTVLFLAVLISGLLISERIKKERQRHRSGPGATDDLPEAGVAGARA